MAKRINLFDKNTYEKVCQENKDLLEDYSLELESKGKSDKTIYQYQADIKAFYCWLYNNKNNEYILDSKKRTFRNFFLSLVKNGTSHNRINRFQSSLRNLLEFAVDDDDEYEDYQVNVMRSIKGLEKAPVREIVFLADDQINIILNYLIRHEDYQRALYLSLSYESAGRRNEVAQVKKTDFLSSNQTNEVIGKRGKKFNLMYFKRSKQIAKLWLAKRGEDDLETMWVHGPKDNRKQVSYEGLYNWVMKFRRILKAKTGEDVAINPHSFRHSALENYSNGSHHVLKELGKDSMPLNVLKIIAHHSSSETTELYLQNHDDELLANAFGLEEI